MDCYPGNCPFRVYTHDGTVWCEEQSGSFDASGERRNAPLVCYVLGKAASAGVPLSELCAIVDRHVGADA